jgi:hypothetical protein
MIEFRESAAHDAERALHQVERGSHLFLKVRFVGYLLAEIGERREGVQ